MRSVSSQPTEYTEEIKYFLGLNISVNNTQIDVHESPDMLNCLPDDRKALDKRPGVFNLFATIGTGSINMFERYRKSTGTVYLFAHGTKLYTFDPTDDSYVEIFDGLEDTEVRGFTFNDMFYILDGSTYRVYDGSTVTTVEGYIPTVAIGTPPSGGGTLFEQVNLISAGFKQQFSGDGSSTVYQLAYDDLDSDTVLASVDGVDLTENVDFTVNRTLGQVTFNSAPSAATANNVTITAYRTFDGNEEQIFQCTIYDLWGGSDGNRVWLSGNSDYQNRDWQSGLLDATYFPANGFDDVGNSDSAIMGYSLLYERQIIIKEDVCFTRQYQENEGDPLFLTARLNGAVGTTETDSIQILDNFPTFLSSKGVYQLTSIDPFNEESVYLVSDKVNNNTNLISIDGIIEMGNLDQYASIDFDKKYWLFNKVNGFAWVYDYEYKVDGVGQWFRLDNMYASAPYEIDGKLYYGDSMTGYINRQRNTTDDGNIYYDSVDSVDSEIECYWNSKILDYDWITNTKLVSKIFFTQKPSTQAAATLYIRNNIKSVWRLVKNYASSLFAYSTLVYSLFTYGGNIFPQRYRAKVKTKKVSFYQIKLENNELYSSFGILDVAFKFLVQREEKRT